jgi:signal transduction histidine kinase
VRRHWALAAAMALLLLLVLGVVQSFRGLMAASEWVEHTSEEQVAMLRLQGDLVDAETGQRGFLASGDSRFLDIYERAISKWPAEFDRVQMLTADNPEQQRRLESLKSLIDAKLGEMDSTMKTYGHRAHDGDLASAMLVGKELMDRIRGLTRDMQREEENVVRACKSDKVRHAQQTLRLFLASTFGFVILVALVSATRQRERRRLGEQFVAVLGHDLRNPLNAITMAASILKRNATGDQKLVDRIQSSAARMSEMVGQLLDLARSRLGGGIPIERKPIALNDVVESACDELRQANPSREIRCTLAPDVRGDWDAERLSQVVSNLVGNAVQHGDVARPIEVRLAKQAREAVLEVQSFGTPISRDLLHVLFEPYRRGGADRRGLGLGLFIVNQIVRSHGGRIEVTSTVEGGTTFCVRLPVSAPARRWRVHPGARPAER